MTTPRADDMRDEPPSGYGGPYGISVGFERIYDDLQTVKADVADIKAAVVPMVKDHEERIRSLEVWRYGIPAAVLVALVGLLVKVLG